MTLRQIMRLSQSGCALRGVSSQRSEHWLRLQGRSYACSGPEPKVSDHHTPRMPQLTALRILARY